MLIEALALVVSGVLIAFCLTSAAVCKIISYFVKSPAKEKYVKACDLCMMIVAAIVTVYIIYLFHDQVAQLFH